MTGYSFHIPRWNQLPSIDLYIDQIIALVDENLSAVLCHHDGFPLTKSMINNYVKAKLVAAPINKKYPRSAVAMVIVICLPRNCYSTDESARLRQLVLSADGQQVMYDRFCDAVENALRDVFAGEIHRKDESLPERDKKYLMENFALSFACKFYVQKTFLQNGV